MHLGSPAPGQPPEAPPVQDQYNHPLACHSDCFGQSGKRIVQKLQGGHEYRKVYNTFVERKSVGVTEDDRELLITPSHLCEHGRCPIQSRNS